MPSRPSPLHYARGVNPDEEMSYRSSSSGTRSGEHSQPSIPFTPVSPQGFPDRHQQRQENIRRGGGDASHKPIDGMPDPFYRHTSVPRAGGCPEGSRRSGSGGSGRHERCSRRINSSASPLLHLPLQTHVDPLAEAAIAHPPYPQGRSPSQSSPPLTPYVTPPTQGISAYPRRASMHHPGTADLDGVGISLLHLPSPDGGSPPVQNSLAGRDGRVTTRDPFLPYEELLCSAYKLDVHDSLRPWDVNACRAAHEEQSGTCLLGCCCLTMPCVLYRERRLLLFHNITGRYICCAGIVPCCAPPPRLRPELYMSYTAPVIPPTTTGRAGSQSSKYALGEYPVSSRGITSIAAVTNPANGLSQYGCYSPHAVPPLEGTGKTADSTAIEDPKWDLGCCQVFCEDGVGVIKCGWSPPACCCDSKGCSCSWVRHPTGCCLACPHFCLVMEVCCCMPCALLANRLLMRQHYHLQVDPMGDVATGCCFRYCMNCLMARSVAKTSDPALASSEPPSSWLTFARSVATCCAATSCLCCVSGCVLAQQRDLREQKGFPLLSSINIPRVSGMV